MDAIAVIPSVRSSVSTFDRTQSAAARTAMAAAIVRNDRALMFWAAASATPVNDLRTLENASRGSVAVLNAWANL